MGAIMSFPRCCPGLNRLNVCLSPSSESAHDKLMADLVKSRTIRTPFSHCRRTTARHCTLRPNAINDLSRQTGASLEFANGPKLGDRRLRTERLRPKYRVEAEIQRLVQWNSGDRASSDLARLEHQEGASLCYSIEFLGDDDSLLRIRLADKDRFASQVPH